MTPKEKADKLYKDAYTRWCHELSHDKNHLTAKDIAGYVCDEIIKDLKESLKVAEDLHLHARGLIIGSFVDWQEVKQEINKL